MVSDQLCHGDFFHYVNPKNIDSLTPLHMATVNIQSLKYVNIVLQIKIKKQDGYYKYSTFKICQYCTSNKNPKIKMAAVYDHFRNFQSCTSICTKMTND